MAVQAMRDGVQEVAVKVLAASQFSGIAEGIQLQVLKKVCFARSASPLQLSHLSPCMQSSLLHGLAPCILLLPFWSRAVCPRQKLFPQLHICEQHLHCTMISGSIIVHISGLASITAGKA